MITQDQLKDMFHYNPDTGVFTRLAVNPRATRWRAGQVAGSIDRLTDYLSYTNINIGRRNYKAHRLAFLYMTGRHPIQQIDHIDGNGLNNSWENLREVSHAENLRNQKMHVTNTSGQMGVSWRADSKKWRVRLCSKTIGHYPTFEQAVAARKQAEAANGYHENHGRKAA